MKDTWLIAVLCLTAAGLLVWAIAQPATSTLPTVIATTANCDILRGVDQGHRYYVADCRPGRLSRRGVMK